MTTMRKLLDELEAISVKKVAGKNQLNENAHQETVNYITKMKEAFGDMEDDSMAPVVSHDEAPELMMPNSQKKKLLKNVSKHWKLKLLI